jgi:hypothetical protein
VKRREFVEVPEYGTMASSESVSACCSRTAVLYDTTVSKTVSHPLVAAMPTQKRGIPMVYSLLSFQYTTRHKQHNITPHTVRESSIISHVVDNDADNAETQEIQNGQPCRWTPSVWRHSHPANNLYVSMSLSLTRRFTCRNLAFEDVTVSV